MGLLERIRKQTLVYWAPEQADEFGKPTYADPVELSCRWEDTCEEFIGPEGARELSTAKVFVGEDVEVKGVMMLGTLEDLTESGDPKLNEGAGEIRRFEKVANIRQTKTLRVAYL